jgi:uncharacterized membrane protein
MSAPQPPALPVLFEAVCAPPRSLGARGALLVSLCVLAAAVLEGVVFVMLGAWPVFGFTLLEAAVVLGLFHLHRRWSARLLEVLVLTETGLTIRRTDHRGAREELAVDPYWARLALEERPGRVSRLLLRQRLAEIEIGRHLGEAEKRDLAEALGGALRRWREPVFDNPQLRPAPGGDDRTGQPG